MRAVVTVLRRPPYYGDVMGAALERLGYAVSYEPLNDPRPGDVFVTWNRHASRDAPVKAHEQAGGTVVVVENGYFGRNFRGSEWFAFALDQHNGAGEWPAGDAMRWGSLCVPLKPWRRDGHEVVVLASRGMGSEYCREPSGWSHLVAKSLKRAGWPVRVRNHPGPQAQCRQDDLEHDLANAWCAVTWGSTAGLKALVMGVPVFHGFPKWIGAAAAAPFTGSVGKPWLGYREPMFHRVATAMWSIDEIASGRPFECLLTSRSTL